MPLRDHFRPPLDNKHSWDGLHAMWPMPMIQGLNTRLAEQYFAMPRVYMGSRYGVKNDTLEPELPNQDVYEVRIYDSRRDRRLVAAIEIISPSNKDRPDRRLAFVSKVATLLKEGICVSLIDVVSTMDFNLYAELMENINGIDPALGDTPPPMYAVTLRTRYEGRRKMMDNWYHPLDLGQPLPTLPIWLTEHNAISLELEPCYEETCRSLRIR